MPAHLLSDRRLLFVGSGLSTALGISSWRTLIERTAREEASPTDAGWIIDLLRNPGQEYKAANELARVLGRDRLEARLIRIVREEQERVCGSAEIHRFTSLLRAVGSAGIVTTNWDTLLPKMTGYESLLWPADSTKFAGALREARPFVLYLHGNIDAPPLVITHDDCASQAKTFQENEFRFETTLAIHTLTVIGSSYPDDHLNQLYAAASRIAGHNSRLRVSLMTADGAQAFHRAHPLLAKGTGRVTYDDYSDFFEALRSVAATCDPSEKLLGLADVNPKNVPGLYEIVSLQPYSFRSVSQLQDAYLDSANSATPADLLNASADILLDASSTRDRVTAGLLATLLSRTSDFWTPSSALLAELGKLCESILNDDPTMIGVVEPLVFALACHDRRDQHRKYIATVLHDQMWRVADISRIGEYYEDRLTQLKAMKRHLSDKRRGGLLGANDIVRLLNLLRIVDHGRPFEEVTRMVQTAVSVLYAAGEDTLAKHATEERDRIVKERKASSLAFENMPE